MKDEKKIIVDKEKLKELLEKDRIIKEQSKEAEEIYPEADCYFYVDNMLD